MDLEKSMNGDINWNKIINETFILLKTMDHFTQKSLLKNQFDKYDYFKRLHQTIVIKCSVDVKKIRQEVIRLLKSMTFKILKEILKAIFYLKNTS